MVRLAPSHLGFDVASDELVERILIPKFYDPDLRLSPDQAHYDFRRLGDLLLPGADGSHLGTWIPREFHGNGGVPYIRTSDLAHWRIRPDYKKGVDLQTYERFKHRSDIRSEDLLFVAHGSYLIGDVALVTDTDLPMLISDHVFRLRADPSAIDPCLLLAGLSTRFVRRQVRARQFSAEIIDKIGDRHLGLRVPVPRDREQASALARRVHDVIAEQSTLRLDLSRIEQGMGSMYWPRASTRLGFELQTDQIRNRVLVPRYYDPDLEQALEKASAEEPWISLGELVVSEILTVSAGVEPGKLAYGTGDIPFVRTSDFAEGELLRDPKHGVSQEIFDKYGRKGALVADDVLIVRDGTYLVGTSALVSAEDLPALYCGGILDLRVAKRDELGPETLLGLLNLGLVRRQIRAKQFSRDVIDTLGARLLEVQVPWKGSRLFTACQDAMSELVRRKARAKEEISAIIEALEPELPRAATGRPGWSMR